MSDPFVEGVRSIVQVCNLVVLVPVALTIVAARGRWSAVVGAVGGVVVGGWLFATTRFGTITDLELRFSAVAVIVAVLILGAGRAAGTASPVATARTMGAIAARTAASPTATWAVPALIGLIVVQWWRPCVGVELGTILTEAPGEPWRQLVPASGFMLGLSVPLVAIGLIYAAWQPSSRLATKGAVAGSLLCAVLAGSVVAGQHGEIVSRLFQWSR